MKLKNALVLLLTTTFIVACGGSSDDNIDDYSKVTCADFSSQASAQAAYNKGAKQLDADNDGKACENLK